MGTPRFKSNNFQDSVLFLVVLANPQLDLACMEDAQSLNKSHDISEMSPNICFQIIQTRKLGWQRIRLSLCDLESQSSHQPQFCLHMHHPPGRNLLLLLRILGSWTISSKTMCPFLGSNSAVWIMISKPSPTKLVYNTMRAGCNMLQAGSKAAGVGLVMTC